MTTKQKKLVRCHWLEIVHRSETLFCNLFFDRLYDIAPELELTQGLPPTEKSRKLIFDLSCLVDNIYVPANIRVLISPMAQLYDGFKVSRYQYAIFGNALLWTLEHIMPFSWKGDIKNAWSTFWIEVSESMIAAQLPQRVRA